MATAHLIRNGRRKLGLLGFGPKGGVSNRDRRTGFCAALEDYELPRKPVFEVNIGEENCETFSQQAIRQRLKNAGSQLPFNGIVCMQDNMAYGAYLALREAGLRVPEDVALVGYDNLNRELFQAAGLQLTSIEQPAEKIGEEGVRLLLGKIEKRDPTIRNSRLFLKPHLIVKNSCGAESSGIPTKPERRQIILQN